MPATRSPRLSELQQWMRWVLTHPRGVAHALRQSHPLNGCAKVIGETRDVDRETRLAIYGNGYFGRIIDVLGSNFSSVKNVIGTDAFHDLARAYLTKHPSTFKSIDDIGHKFSRFIKTQRVARKYPFLSDLAAVEWAAHQSFFADNVPAVDPKRLQNIPESKWRAARFELDGSVRLVKTSWLVGDLWRADGKTSRKHLATLKKGRYYFVIFRSKDKFVRVARLTPPEFDLLEQLATGKSLANALLALAKKHGQVLAVGTWFNEWIGDGFFKRISIDV